MKKNELKIVFDIYNGVWMYKDRKAREKIAEFKKTHEGKSGEITFKINEGVEYWQHKYFHGFILPVIAEGQGEKDLGYLKEYVLKQEFLFSPVSNLKEIPSRHRQTCRIIECEVIKPGGEIAVELKGYVPSTTTLSFEEFKDFILKCEHIRDGLIDWEMPAEAMMYRKLAFGQKIEQGELF